MANYGITIPFSDQPLSEQKELYRELVDIGYTDVWTAEVDGFDGFTPLVLAAAWAPELRVGVAIIPAFTRGPATLAGSIAALADAAPGRVVIGIGSSSNVIVEKWNDIPFEEPYKKTRDMVRFLRMALTGEKVTETYDTFQVSGYRLAKVPQVQPKLLVAGLRNGMLRMAGRESDGAIINWLSAEDVLKVRPVVEQASGDRTPEIVARLFVCPNPDAETVRAQAKRAIAAYLNVPVYAEFQRSLGRGDQLKGMWDNWQAGDRKAALAAIPDSVVDELIIHGTPEECREHVARFVANGVDTPALAVMPFGGIDPVQAVRDLAPR